MKISAGGRDDTYLIAKCIFAGPLVGPDKSRMLQYQRSLQAWSCAAPPRKIQGDTQGSEACQSNLDIFGHASAMSKIILNLEIILRLMKTGKTESIRRWENG